MLCLNVTVNKGGTQKNSQLSKLYTYTVHKFMIQWIFT